MSVRIYPPEAGELNPNYWIDPRFIYKNLERFFEEARVCGLFKDANDANGIAINLLAVEPNGLVLKVIPADDGARPSLMHRYTLVTFVDGGKVQFEINKLRATQEGSYIADLPKAMAVIQRRKGFRTPGPGNFDRDFKLLIYFTRMTQKMSKPVLLVNISQQSQKAKLVWLKKLQTVQMKNI